MLIENITCNHHSKMNSKVVLTLFCASVLILVISSSSVDGTLLDGKRLLIPDPRFPKLIQSISNHSEIYDNQYSYQYYFDDGKIASEVMTLRNITRVNEKYDDEYSSEETDENQSKLEIVTVAVGEGFFRFVVKQKFYSFKYNASENGIQGELSYSALNGTIITEHLKSSFNEFSQYPPVMLNESETFRVSYRRLSYSDGYTYSINFMFSNNSEHGRFECDLETNTQPQYFFTCSDPSETISYEWMKQLYIYDDESGSYTVNYTLGDEQIFETRIISENQNFSSGLILISSRNGFIKVKYTSDSSGNNVKMSYPFNNGTVISYYYPDTFMPDEQHNYISVEGQRELIQLDKESILKLSIEVQYIGPNGSGDEHVTWIHKFDIDGQSFEYGLSAVAPTLQVLQSLVG